MDTDQAKAAVRRIAEDLQGRTIPTLAQARPNAIIDVSAEGITVRAKSVQLVRWEWVDEVIDALARSGEVTGVDLRKKRVTGGFRSAFIFALLARTPFARAEVDRGVVRLKLASP